MITIHYDFTNGTEVSYKEGLELKDNFNTNCLDFFSFDEEVDDVIVIDKLGNSISRNDLLGNVGNHTDKDIRVSHNIHKMLKANSFKWLKPSENLLEFEYEIFINDKDSPFEINTWIPISTDRIKDVTKINKYIENGVLRKIKYK